MQILVLIGAVGASLQIGQILPLCDFLTVLFFLEHTPRLNRRTVFPRKRCLLGFRTMGDVIRGNMPQPTSLPLP